MTADPKLQAFLEDLVAVYAKHQLVITSQDGYASVRRICAEDGGASFTEVYYGEDGAPPALWLVHVEAIGGYTPGLFGNVAVAPIPTTAHGRLSAAARVAALRAEGEA